MYLYLNDNGNTQISRQIDIQSRKLKISQNYEVFNDKDIVQTEMQRLLDKEKNATSPLNNPKIRNSRNSFRLSCLTKPINAVITIQNKPLNILHQIKNLLLVRI